MGKRPISRKPASAAYFFRTSTELIALQTKSRRVGVSDDVGGPTACLSSEQARG
jgi:hypothetical protein